MFLVKSILATLLFIGENNRISRANLDPRGPRGTSYDVLKGEAPPERDTFFSLQAHERVWNSLVEVYERVVKSVMTVGL